MTSKYVSRRNTRKHLARIAAGECGGRPKELPGEPVPRDGLAELFLLNTGLRCPNCGAGKKYQRICDARWKGRRAFACRKCQRDYQATTGTILANSHRSHRERVMQAARLLVAAPHIMPTELAEKCNASKKWAYKWRQRILAALAASDSFKERA